MMIDSLMEMMRIYNQPESIQPNDLTELILSQITWTETSGHHIPGVCDGILQTYICLKEYDEEKLNMVSHAEAEKVMQKYYVQGGTQATRVKCTLKGFGEGFTWPESFTYRADGQFPIDIAKKVGFTIGYIDGIRAIKIRDKMLKEAVSG